MRAGRALSLCLFALATLAGCAAGRATLDDRGFELSASWIGDRPVVAWYGGRLRREALFMAIMDADGRKARVLQLTDASRDAYEPSVQALDADVVVAWYEQATAAQGMPAPQVALLARFDASGRRLWQRQLSSTDARGRIPVVRARAGTVHVAWVEQRAEQAPTLRVAALDGAGNWQREPADVATVSPDTWNLNAAVDEQGTLHVVYDSSTASHAKELQWISAGQGGIGRQSGADDGRDSVFPDLVLDGSRYALSWVDSRDGNDEVYLRCGELGGAGSEIAPSAGDSAARRVTRSSTQASGAYLAWHGGGLELAWIETRGDERQLWRQSFDRDCIPRSAAAHLSDAGSRVGIPALASGPGGLALAWNRLRGASSKVLLEVSPTQEFSPSAAAR